jgi:hypothetical protein
MLIPYIIPKTRGGLKIVMIIIIAMLTAFSVIVFCEWSADQAALKKNGQPSFNTLSKDELKDGLLVKGSIDMALDSYAEEYETNFGVRTSDNSETLYYLIPMYDTYEDGSIAVNYLITYEAGPKDFSSMDAIFNQTWSETAEPAVFTVENAQIVNLPTDLKQYYTEWAQDPQFYKGGSYIDWCVENNIFGTGNRNRIESKLVPYMIRKTATAGTDINIMWGLLALDAICIIILLVLIFRKAPLKGIADTPAKEDFSKINEMDGK